MRYALAQSPLLHPSTKAVVTSSNQGIPRVDGWPRLDCFVHFQCLECDGGVFDWIGQHKRLFFRIETCLGGKPRVPELYSVKDKAKPQRSAYYRLKDVRIVSSASLPGWEQRRSHLAATYAAVDLIRIREKEFACLDGEPPMPPPRGRPANERLRLQDFAPTPLAQAIATHWIQNPVPPQDGGYAQSIHRFFPKELMEACQNLSPANPAHPFSDYIREPFENHDLRHFRALSARDFPGFTFIDLFAGIGGFRIALQQEGGRCVFSSDIDAAARETYERNFRVVPFGDITNPMTKLMIPRQFDVLCGGFPCQAFSMAGMRKGFEDEKRRGILYREIVEIARMHQPKAIFCENVRGLLSLDKGKAYRTIVEDIEGAGYTVVFSQLLNSKDYGVPQNRVRLYIVALRNDLFRNMQQQEIEFPETPPPVGGVVGRTIGDIREEGPVSKSVYPGQSYLETLIRHKAKHKGSGKSGFGFIVRRDDEIAGTLMCGGMGRERNMLVDHNQPDWTSPKLKKGGINTSHYRFMTVREYARLQGFPDAFILPEYFGAGQKLFGNSVTVTAVRAVARAMLDVIQRCE